MKRKYDLTRPEKPVYSEPNSNPPTKAEMTTPQFVLSYNDEPEASPEPVYSAGMTAFDRVMLRLTLLIISFLAIVFAFFLILMKPILIIPIILMGVAILGYRTMLIDVEKK